MQKAIFLDLDGTLLNSQKEITDGNRRAIERALALGHKIIINTGRPLVSAVKQAEKLGLDSEGCFLIAYNGGVLFDMGQRRVLASTTVPISVVYEVFAEAKKRGIHIQTYDETHTLVEPDCDDYEVKRYCNLVRMEYRVLSDIHEFRENPVKMLLIDLENHEALVDFRDWILENHGDVLNAFFSCKEYVEVVRNGLSKGDALCKMAEHLQIPIEDTFAAGDEANDIAMIEAAGFGVAMQNAIPAVKEIADYVTQNDNNNDGIAEFLERFVLNETGL